MAMFGRVLCPTDGWLHARLRVIVFLIAGCTVTILLDPGHVLDGFGLAVRVPAVPFFEPLAGFFIAARGNGEAGSGSSDGGGFGREMLVVERMNVLILEGFLPA